MKPLKKAKKVVSDLQDKTEESEDVFKALEKLGKLRDQGVITDEEFEEKKQALLDQI